MRRPLLVGAVLLAGLLWLGHRSGNQPPRDAVAVAQRELGIELATSRVDVGDVTLHVVSAGPEGGPPVLLLHGFPEFWYAWQGAIVPLTRAGFRVILPDQRGFGASEKPDGVEAYRLDHLGDDLAGLIAALGYESAFVAAHDFGGGAAWNLAIRHPERVRKLAVLDTPHPGAYQHVEQERETTSWYRTLFQIPLLPEEMARWGNWYVLSKMLRDTAQPGAFPDAKLDLYRSAWASDGAFGTMVNWYRAVFRYGGDAETSGERVRVPVLIVLAAHDAFIAPERTRASLALCDDARLVELGSGTHWALQEEPERVAARLIEFFVGDTPARP
jgi:pimeloyl-ACP methyl ester carboxylesterase